MNILYIACLFLLFPPNANAQSDSWSYFNKQSNTAKATATNATTAEDLSYQELEQRKRDNASLSTKIGITVPEAFNQKLLRPSGATPKTADDLSNIRKIKQAEGQQDLNKKRISIKKKNDEAEKRKAFLAKQQITNKSKKYNYKKKKIYRTTPKRTKTYNPYSFSK